MGPLSKNSDIINQLYLRTKVKKTDIIDLLKVLPECMADTFINSNPDMDALVEFGFISIRWKKGRGWGAIVTATLPDRFKRRITEHKIERKTPLGQKLYESMHPINKERAEKRIKAKNNIT